MGFHKFLQDVESTEFLSREEEARLIRRWRRKKDVAARDRLITHNLRYVTMIAQRYRRSAMPYEDIVSEGIMGMIQALEAFDPRFGVRFGTYAAYYMRAYIRKALFYTLTKGHRPSFAMHHNKQIAEAKRKAANEPHSDSYKELAADTNTSEYEAFLACEGREISYDFERFGRFEDVDKVLLLREIKDGVRASLKGRDRDVVMKRFFEDLTLKEIGDMYGISRERVRQIEKKAKEALRRAQFFARMDKSDIVAA